jgi:hypothetical protein
MTNKISAIYLPANPTVTDIWIQVAKRLDCEFNIVPKYFVHHRIPPYSNTPFTGHEILPGCFFHNHLDAWKGLGFAEVRPRNVLDHDLLASIAHHELIAIKMMDRMDPNQDAFSFTHRQYFFRDLLVRWLDIIDEMDIRLVISPPVPHRVYDYALYVAAKMKGIHFISFQVTPFRQGRLIINDVDALPEWLKERLRKGSCSDVDGCDLPEFMLPVINKVRSSYEDAKPAYMQDHDHAFNKRIATFFRKLIVKILKLDLFHAIKLRVVKTTWSSHVIKGEMPQTSFFSKLDIIFYRRRFNREIRMLEKKYSGLCTNQYRKKFILVALHYQPEQTTCPTGGVYADQLLIIQMLNNFLPADFDIVVKEHNAQFFLRMESSAGRSKVFYDRLMSISGRVKCVPVDADPFALIDAAIATVTVSGTIGWESAFRGTPTIVFGRAWYEDMPRVFKVRNLSDLVKAWPTILELKNKDLSREISNYLSILHQNSVYATHNTPESQRAAEETMRSIDQLTACIGAHVETVSL